MNTNQGNTRTSDLEEATAELRKARDGSLYGWADRGEITALIVIYTGTDYGPGFSPMPRTGVPEDRWPPFADESLFGSWFWDYRDAGRIVDLGPVIGGTEGIVFWSVRHELLESATGVMAVRCPLAAGCGLVLPAGVYAYYRALCAGADIPALGEVLADRERIDLGLRFAGYRDMTGA